MQIVEKNTQAINCVSTFGHKIPMDRHSFTAKCIGIRMLV